MLTLKEHTARYIKRVALASGGDRREIQRYLGISRATFYRWLQDGNYPGFDSEYLQRCRETRRRCRNPPDDSNILVSCNPNGDDRRASGSSDNEDSESSGQ